MDNFFTPESDLSAGRAAQAIGGHDPSNAGGSSDGRTAHPRFATFLGAMTDRLTRILARDGLTLSHPTTSEFRVAYWDTDDGELLRAGVAAGASARGGRVRSFVEPLDHAPTDLWPAGPPSPWSGLGGSAVGGVAIAEDGVDTPLVFTYGDLVAFLGLSDRIDVSPRVRGPLRLGVEGTVTVTERRVSSDSTPIGALLLEEGSFRRGSARAQRLMRVTVREHRVGSTFLDDTLSRLCGIHSTGPATHRQVLQLMEVEPQARAARGPRVLSPALSARAAGLALVRKQWDRILAMEAAVRLGVDSESVHDMRVAARRLRAAQRLYRAFLPAEWFALRDECRWLGQVLGAVRDLDVQRVRLRTWSETLTSEEAAQLERLDEELTDRRIDAHEALVRALNSDRYSVLVTKMGDALEPCPPEAGAAPVALVAPWILRDARRRFRKLRKRLTKDSHPGAVHEVRIRGKVLRYALEFHRALYGDEIERLVGPLVELQDQLGAHQDLVTAEDRLRAELAVRAGTCPPALAFLMGRLAERCREEARVLRLTIAREPDPIPGRAWRRLERRMAGDARRALRRIGEIHSAGAHEHDAACDEAIQGNPS
jgi:CHAD domain-containing protein